MRRRVTTTPHPNSPLWTIPVTAGTVRGFLMAGSPRQDPASAHPRCTARSVPTTRIPARLTRAARVCRWNTRPRLRGRARPLRGARWPLKVRCRPGILLPLRHHARATPAPFWTATRAPFCLVWTDWALRWTMRGRSSPAPPSTRP